MQLFRPSMVEIDKIFIAMAAPLSITSRITWVGDTCSLAYEFALTQKIVKRPHVYSKRNLPVSNLSTWEIPRALGGMTLYGLSSFTVYCNN